MVSGMVTNRHNWVVRYLAGVYMRGKNGGYWCRYNAGSEERGSTHHTIPEWMLDSGPWQPRGPPRGKTWMDELIDLAQELTPDLPLHEIGKVPDIAVVWGVRPSKGDDIAHWAELPNPRGVKLMILEVGYTTDDGWQNKVAEKRKKYLPLTELLRRKGWKVDLRTLVLGYTGLVYEHTLDVLDWLGVDRKKAREKMAGKLARHGTREANDILNAYEERLRLRALG